MHLGRLGEGQSLRTSWASLKGALSHRPGTWVDSESDALLRQRVKIKLQLLIIACLQR